MQGPDTGTTHHLCFVAVGSRCARSEGVPHDRACLAYQHSICCENPTSCAEPYDRKGPAVPQYSRTIDDF